MKLNISPRDLKPIEFRGLHFFAGTRRTFGLMSALCQLSPLLNLLCHWRLRRIVMLVLTFCILHSAFTGCAQGTTGYQLSPQQPNFYRTDTNNGIFPLTLTNGAAFQWISGGLVSTNGPLLLTLRQGVGLSVFVDVISSNACLSPGNGAVTLGWDVGPDRIQDTTTQPFKLTVPTANLTNNTATTPGVLVTNTYWTNWPPAVLDNLRTIQLTTATNTLENIGINTNTITVRVRYSFSGK